jgi:chromosome segregation ATPase
MKTTMLAAAAAALVLAPLASEAQSYRCVGKDGKRYYGSTVPMQCIGRPVEELNGQGMVVKRIDPEGSEKERVAKEAQEAKQREELSAQREAARRNRALLATYTSVKDIDDALARALAENQKGIDEVQGRIDRIRKLQTGYEKELELHKGKGAAPARLTEDLHNTEADLKYQEQMLAAKQKELEHINAKYSADRKRYAELTGGR